jgi:hypothetical protein
MARHLLQCEETGAVEDARTMDELCVLREDDDLAPQPHKGAIGKAELLDDAASRHAWPDQRLEHARVLPGPRDGD